MNIDAPNLNHLWAQLMVEELIRNGVTHFFVAPGSRSSPLALAVASRVAGATASSRRGKPRGGTPSLHVHFDERGLAFAALGCARATGIPAVVITTSGTAVANLFPAVIEASMDHVPMILLTGDRPPELRDCGANQAIDQLKIFGGYVRWFFDLPCPDEKISPRFVLTTIDHAFARAAVGPVHLNCQFREPLAPIHEAFDAAGMAKQLKRWLACDEPFTHQDGWATPVSSREDIETTARALASCKTGVIVAGDLRCLPDLEATEQLAAHLGWPILPSLQSGLRFRDAAPVAPFADQLLLSEVFANRHKPDAVIHCGRRITSKRIQNWCATCGPKVFLVAGEQESRFDPLHCVTHRLLGPVHHEIGLLRHLLPKTNNRAWLLKWTKASHLAGRTVAALVTKAGLSEPGIAQAVSNLLPTTHALWTANSMPVRDLDMFAAAHGKTIRCIANRGASGIDGTIASARGFAISTQTPVSLVIGDLALLHDLNSLALLRGVKKPFVIVVINNDGGAIFSFLPVANYPQHFEQVFGTPHGLGFSKAAELFGLAYENPTTAADFEAAYRQACGRHGATLIEVRTDRAENLRVHRKIQDAVRKAVDKIS